MSHHKGLSNLPYQDSVFTLSLECLLVVLYGLFWLLDVHEGSCHQFEVFYRTLCIQDFEAYLQYLQQWVMRWIRSDSI